MLKNQQKEFNNLKSKLSTQIKENENVLKDYFVKTIISQNNFL